MPDFSEKAVHLHWKRYPDPMIYRVVAFMESVESWVVDSNPELEAALVQLGKECDDLDPIDLEKLGQQEFFIRLANHLSMPRALRLLQALDVAQPGSAHKLIKYADKLCHADSNNKEAELFLRRNTAFERLRLLARIFSSERINFLLKVLDGE